MIASDIVLTPSGGDDTVQISNAIASIPDGGGPDLVLMPGTYNVTGIAESKPGLVVKGRGHIGFGPGNQYLGQGTQIKCTFPGAWAWSHNTPTGANEYRGARFENLCFVGNGQTAGGLRLRTNHNLVVSCSAVGHTTGVGLKTAGPGTGNQAGLNRVRDCTTQDCLVGFEAGEPGVACYTHFSDCIALKFTVGGIVFTGAGFRIYDDKSTIIGGHAEGHAIGVECKQALACQIIGMTFENNQLHDIALNRASGVNGTRNLVVCATSKILIGPYQIGDVIIGGDWQTLTDNGQLTLELGHERLRIARKAPNGVTPTGGYSGEVQIDESALWFKDGAVWRSA